MASIPELPRAPTPASRGRDPSAVIVGLFLAVLAGCGGGGGGGSATPPAAPPPPPPPAPAPAPAADYPASVVLGVASAQDLQFIAGAGAVQSQVIAPSASTLLVAGLNPLAAEYDDPSLPGWRVACVSGPGDTTNVVTGINAGVIGKSAAILFASGWTAVDVSVTWAALVSAGASLAGWENCGLKPEGLPSASSQLRPDSDGGYTEDVYDGNPGTTFNVITQVVSATQVEAMMSDAGFLTTADPGRLLRLTLRAFADAGGHAVLVERGEPAPGAAAGTLGFVALYEPAP